MLLDKLQALDLQLILSRAGLVILALVLLWIARRLIQRIFIPRLNRLIQRTDSQIDDAIVQASNVPISLLFWAVAIYVAAGIIWATPPDFVPHLTRTLIIVSVFSAVYQLVGLLTRTASILARLTGIQVDEKLLPFIRTALKLVVVALAVVVVLQEWEFDVAGLVAGLGVSGLAVALAAEDTIANLFGFTTIVGDQPLAVGEYIVTPDVSGTVEHVGFRSTRIRKLDQALVTIPNKTLAGSVVTNWSRLEKRRIDMTIGLTYATTSAQLREFMRRVEALLKARESIDADSVTVLFTGFGASSLDVRLIAYVMMADWTQFMQEQQAIMLEIMDIVEAMGLGFAFPSQSIYIEQMPSPAATEEFSEA
ncbi:MAG: mechanosensitive ion channel family protein [Anaerolineae bacterium]